MTIGAHLTEFGGFQVRQWNPGDPLGDPAGVDEAQLRAFAAERLSPYKLPSRIIVAALLPAAPTGKILKTRLVETFARELAAGAAE